MRQAREQLNTDDTARPRFGCELTIRHAQAVSSGIWLALLAVVLAGLAVLTTLGAARWPVLAAWTVTTCLAYGTLFLTARRMLASAEMRTEAGAWQSRLTILHGVVGACWAALFAVDGFASSFSVAGWPFFGTLLLAMALHVLLSANLTIGLALVYGPPLFVFALRAGLDLTPQGAMVAGYALAATAMFAWLAHRVQTDSRATIQSMAEKDLALVDAEEAGVHSDEARRRAEEANLAKTRFLAQMSHELRTPLNAIIGFSEVMQAEMFGPLGHDKYKGYLGDIHQSGSHLLKLINEILDLSRVEAGRFDMHEEAVDLVAIAQDAIQMIRLKAEAKDLNLNLRPERDLPRVWADERAVRQVILNLLSNAVKFTPKGGHVVVKVGWTKGRGQYIAVSDTGPGIPEEEMELVLSSFGQGSIALRVAEPGTGLGLPIVKAFVEMHDGKFTLASQLRKGTQATAIFPRRRVMADVLPNPQAPRKRPAFAAA